MSLTRPGERTHIGLGSIITTVGSIESTIPGLSNDSRTKRVKLFLSDLTQSQSLRIFVRINISQFLESTKNDHVLKTLGPYIAPQTEINPLVNSKLKWMIGIVNNDIEIILSIYSLRISYIYTTYFDHIHIPSLL